MTTLIRACGLALVFFLAAGAGPALAQGSSSNAQAQQERAETQPLNNAPVWREVRSGNQGYSSLPGREMGVLVQSAGETWRQIRNGPVTIYGGWLLVIAVLALAAIYFALGPVKLHEKPTGRLVERFSTVERWAHWSTAITFVVLAATGLIMLFGKHVLLPVIGYTLFGWLTALSKNLHNFVAPLFAVSVLALILACVRWNRPIPLPASAVNRIRQSRYTILQVPIPIRIPLSTSCGACRHCATSGSRSAAIRSN